MTLQNAIESQTPTELALYTYNKFKRQFTHIHTVQADSAENTMEHEANETIRRIAFEQTYGFSLMDAIDENEREFADELQDAEAESGMARIVWQEREGEFSAPRFIHLPTQQ